MQQMRQESTHISMGVVESDGGILRIAGITELDMELGNVGLTSLDDVNITDVSERSNESLQGLTGRRTVQSRVAAVVIDRRDQLAFIVRRLRKQFGLRMLDVLASGQSNDMPARLETLHLVESTRSLTRVRESNEEGTHGDKVANGRALEGCELTALSNVR